MREHHAFRQTGGAARIRQRDEVVLRIDLDVRNFAIAFEERCEWRCAFRFAERKQLFDVCSGRRGVRFL